MSIMVTMEIIDISSDFGLWIKIYLQLLTGFTI